jgi:predicted  nucleic acid-binding Zn-ribbon protein
MGLKKLAAKVADYNDRLERGKASKIKPEDVNKVLKKLRTKEASLEARMSQASDPDEKASLQRKCAIAREHIGRAEWLLSEIT